MCYNPLNGGRGVRRRRFGMKYGSAIKTTLTTVFILLFGVGAVGCSSVDGKVQSSVTGNYSSEQEIRVEYSRQKLEINLEADELGMKQSRLVTRNTALDSGFESDIGLVASEIAKKNEWLTSGIGITKTIVDAVVPGSEPFTSMAVNWLGDIGILGGLGFGAVKFGRRKGASDIATNFATKFTEAAEKDPEMRKLIKEGNVGDVLKKIYQSSPKVAQNTIDRHKII